MNYQCCLSKAMETKLSCGGRMGVGVGVGAEDARGGCRPTKVWSRSASLCKGLFQQKRPWDPVRRCVG